MKQATILNDTVVFETTNKEGRTIDKLAKGEYVEYKREKYRKGIIWLEIILQNSTVGYIDLKDAFKWVRNKVLGKSVTFYPDNIKNDNKNNVILKGGEVVYKILPT